VFALTNLHWNVNCGGGPSGSDDPNGKMNQSAVGSLSLNG